MSQCFLAQLAVTLKSKYSSPSETPSFAKNIFVNNINPGDDYVSPNWISKNLEFAINQVGQNNKLFCSRCLCDSQDPFGCVRKYCVSSAEACCTAKRNGSRGYNEPWKSKSRGSKDQFWCLYCATKKLPRQSRNLEVLHIAKRPSYFL